MAEERTYVCIDLKSFYASVECVERGLDPLTAHLVVADASRTEKTICLAVSPALKSYGIPGRARLFEVVERVRAVNAERRRRAPGHTLTGEALDARTLADAPDMALGYIAATPRMALYMACSARVYQIYLRYLAPEDIHVYSIDEVFLDVTHYLGTYGLTARELTRRIIGDVLAETGVTATAGIGTNLYLCKIAMDVVAKRVPPDAEGVRIAELTERSYRAQLWDHRPLTDFWRVGRGYAAKLEARGLWTMGDIARCSLGGPADFYNEKLLYDLFGVAAELLIDHAWGWEPCTMAEIKAYRPRTNSVSSGQVLPSPYPHDKTRLLVREMTELLVLDLVDKGVVTDQLTLTLGYDVENLTDPVRRRAYRGEVTTDPYGRKIPKHAHGTANLDRPCSSTKLILRAVTALFDRIADEQLLVRRLTLTANRLTDAAEAARAPVCEQLDLFSAGDAEARCAAEDAALEREKRMQQAMLKIRKKYGKNAILKGMNLEEGATTVTRNEQIGGHKK